MGKVIGIDLGTTNSLAAVLDGPMPRALDNREGKTLTRSWWGSSSERAKRVSRLQPHHRSRQSLALSIVECARHRTIENCRKTVRCAQVDPDYFPI